MKTEFNLKVTHHERGEMDSGYKLKIIGQAPKHKPYLSINFGLHQVYHLADKDLERFSVNILKALKSKKLKP